MRLDSRVIRVAIIVLAAAAVAGPALAAFSDFEVFLPMVGRDAGVGTSNWYTLVLAYNPNAVDATVSFYFLERGADNRTAVPVTLTLKAGEVKRWEDVVTEMFQRSGWGALRITSDQRIVVNERFYSRDPALTIKDSMGQYFAGIPRSFAIKTGELTEILGVYQTVPSGSSELRFNYGCVETEGAQVVTKATLYDGATGAQIGTTRQTTIKPYSNFQMNGLTSAFSGQQTQNGRLKIEATSGSGRAICYGTGIANVTQDPTTFEMRFKEDLLVSSRKTGLFHGAMWSSDGTIVEAGIELAVDPAGILSYSGAAGLQCGDDLYVLELSDALPTPIAVAADGSFTATVTIPYEDAGAVVFTTVWTLNGKLGPDGVATGTLRSDTSGGSGAWAACNGVNVVRNWRAGWTQNPT